MPKRVGPYKIDSFLEERKGCLIYLGTDEATGNPLTIKVLPSKSISRPEMVDKFLNEVHIISITSHPNIVKLYGEGVWEGGLYLATEYIAGIPLWEFIQGSPLPLKKAIQITLSIGKALGHLHGHGIVHADLNPDNILINEAEEVKLVDFGIAELTESSTFSADQRALQKRTPYLSPEQRSNPAAASYASDIYSLGVIGYELILGKPCQGQFNFPLLPQGVRSIISKALQPKPQDRYEDIVDFIQELSKYLSSSTLESEKKGGDKLGELYSHLNSVQRSMHPAVPPSWKDMEIGLATYEGLQVIGVYYDFFELPDGAYGIVLGESATKGVEGIVYTAMLRGMIKSLSKEIVDPKELIVRLNTLISADPLEAPFVLSYLTLMPRTNQLRFISCGYSGLWWISSEAKTVIKLNSDNIALGIDPETTFTELERPLLSHDKLLLCTFMPMPHKDGHEKFTEQDLQRVLTDNLHATPQQLVETILEETKHAYRKTAIEQSLSLICVERK